MKPNLFLSVTCIAVLLFSFVACISKTPTHKEPLDTEALTRYQKEVHGTEVKAADIQITHPLNTKWVADGKNIYDVKCSACHKLTSEKLIGPGWKGVTDRRTPEWIMNFITNTEEMIEKDTAAQNMLEVCLVKMPNQGLSETDARNVLEIMRKNDGKQ